MSRLNKAHFEKEALFLKMSQAILGSWKGKDATRSPFGE